MKQSIKTIYTFIPTIGILVFFALFYLASLKYPGGSQADLQKLGFDWMNNYWCNLTDSIAMNGQKNSARNISILAMILLCISLSFFFASFSNMFINNALLRKLTKIFGFVPMAFTSLLFTEYHNVFTILSSIFGLVAVIGISYGLAKSSLHLLKYWAVFCVALLVFNNFIYQTKLNLSILPLLQKITFVSVLFWVIAVNFVISKRAK
jgi:hypothetical protein